MAFNQTPCFSLQLLHLLQDCTEDTPQRSRRLNGLTQSIRQSRQEMPWLCRFRPRHFHLTRPELEDLPGGPMCFESMAKWRNSIFTINEDLARALSSLKKFVLKYPPWQWRGVAPANKAAYYYYTKNISAPAHTLHPASSTPGPRLSDLWV